MCFSNENKGTGNYAYSSKPKKLKQISKERKEKQKKGPIIREIKKASREMV